MSQREEVFKVLDELNIPYKIAEHPAVYTAEEAEEYRHLVEGSRCKNLFLRNGKGKAHYLVILDHSKNLDLKGLGEILDEKRMALASEGRLKKYLGLTPGSVSVFGLLNDKNREVNVVLDEDLQKEEKINFHPNDNTATITIMYTDLLKFLEWSGNRVIVHRI